MLQLQTPNGDTRVLLHSCCAPCSSAIIECMLANGIRPTVFYCNPNIYPLEEYEIRKQEAIRFVTSQGLDFVDADYDHTLWQSRMKGLEEEPERGRRCLRCFLVQHEATGETGGGRQALSLQMDSSFSTRIRLLSKGLSSLMACAKGT